MDSPVLLFSFVFLIFFPALFLIPHTLPTLPPPPSPPPSCLCILTPLLEKEKNHNVLLKGQAGKVGGGIKGATQAREKQRNVAGRTRYKKAKHCSG